MRIYIIDLAASALPDARPAPPEGVFVLNDDARTRDQETEITARLARAGYHVRIATSDGGVDDLRGFVEAVEAEHQEEEG